MGGKAYQKKGACLWDNVHCLALLMASIDAHELHRNLRTSFILNNYIEDRQMAAVEAQEVKQKYAKYASVA